MTQKAILGYPRGSAVVVILNRRTLKTGSRTMLAAQARPRDVVAAVDNASTHGCHDAIRVRFPNVGPVRPTGDTGHDSFEFKGRMPSHRTGTYLSRGVVVHQGTEPETKLVDRAHRFHREVRNGDWVLHSGQAFAPAQAGHDLEPHR